MNFITACFDEYDSAMSELLAGAGFSAQQAARFLSVASADILNTYKHKDIERIISAFGSKEVTQFIDLLDIDLMAKKAGMSPEETSIGLKTIAPVISQAFKHNSDGMVGAAISIAWEEKRDFVSIAKKLFSS